MLPDTAAWKAAVCVQVDRMEEARGLVDRFVRNVHSIWDGKKTPDASAFKQYLLDVNPMRREEDIELLLDSLHRAGLPQ